METNSSKISYTVFQRVLTVFRGESYTVKHCALHCVTLCNYFWLDERQYDLGNVLLMPDYPAPQGPAVSCRKSLDIFTYGSIFGLTLIIISILGRISMLKEQKS